MLSQKKLKNYSKLVSQKISNSKLNLNYFIEPYKHLVIDNFFEKDLVDKCLSNFPEINENQWEFSNDKDIEIKYRSKWTSEFDIPEGLVDAIRIMNGADFLRSVSEVFQIQKLVPDSYFAGGGLNITKKGGLLDVHVDGNYHDATGLNRRLNALFFLNPGWKKEWGGEFGLYDENGDKCVKKIEPILNRIIIMETTVQFIEFIFYIWLVFSIQARSMNVTAIRYIDWFITTPIMLITTILFMAYNSNKEEFKNKENIITVKSVFKKDYKLIIQFVFYNFLMLLFGFLGEMNILNRYLSLSLGTLFFLLSFNIIYQYYGKLNDDNKDLFYFIFIVWALYGVSYLFNYQYRNASYNILDIFSKNFYGLYIFYKILKKKNSYN